MRALTFWQTVPRDRTNMLKRFIAPLSEHGIRYCVSGGQAVNAYVEPVVSLDLDLVVAVEQLEELEALLSQAFKVSRFPHSLNVSLPGSDLRAQIQTDPRYFPFIERTTEREVLGLRLPVAHVEDVPKGKVWATQDPSQRPSKRQKDLADIARLLEAYPTLRSQVPPGVLDRLM